jgi:hypothetical protein
MGAKVKELDLFQIFEMLVSDLLLSCIHGSFFALFNLSLCADILVQILNLSHPL